jgi:hypothetical protein
MMRLTQSQKVEEDPSDKCEYQVQQVLDHHLRGMKQQLKIRWSGYASRWDTWELRSQIQKGAPERVKAYFEKKVGIRIEKVMKHREQDNKVLYLCLWTHDGEEAYRTWEDDTVVSMERIIEYIRL